MIEVMEDVRNDKKEVLQECFRLFKPGGELALSVQTSSTLSKALRWLFKEPHRQLRQQLGKSPLVKFGVSLYGVFKKPRGAPKSSQRETPPMVDAESRFKVLGVEVDAVEIQGAVARMESWIQKRNACHSIAATSMHGIVEAQRDQRFKEILNSTDLVVPDGMPLVWLGRRQGYRLPRRVYGPDLMLTFFETTAARGYRHFFYGGEPGVAERLAKSLQARFPGSQVAGTFSPPFRPLTEAEDNDVVSLISRAAPDVLWVGLGTPRQEHWMHLHRSRMGVPVQVSVGAAFDILSGRRRQAPCWMRERGLEWLFRFLQEPRRLWRRYLLYGGLFVVLVVTDACTSTLASGRTIFSQI